VAEIDVDISRFPTPDHLVSLAHLRPRNDESAGKRRSTRVRKSADWLKTTVAMAAGAAARKNDNHLRAQFLCIESRRGSKKAIVAVAASMLAAAFYVLRDAVKYATSAPFASKGATRPRPSAASFSGSRTWAARSRSPLMQPKVSVKATY